MSERGSVVVDYSREPVPALSEADAAWVDTLLRQKVSANDVCVLKRENRVLAKGISLSQALLLKVFQNRCDRAHKMAQSCKI